MSNKYKITIFYNGKRTSFIVSKDAFKECIEALKSTKKTQKNLCPEIVTLDLSDNKKTAQVRGEIFNVQRKMLYIKAEFMVLEETKQRKEK